MAKTKANFLWTAINNISNGKKVISRDKFVDKEYNAYMVIKALSMDSRLAPYLEPFNNKSARTADPYLHYLTLFGIIPKQYRKTSFTKGSQNSYDKNMVNAVATYYQVSQRKAEGYIDRMTKDQKKYLLDLCISTGIIIKE